MLDTVFPRPLGDVGHPDTFPVPVRQVVVKGAWPEKVVQTAASMRALRLLEPFRRMFRQLETEGALSITTSCGFLVLFQLELQAAVRVPVVTSSLLQLPRLLSLHPRVGVLTISSAKLGAEHLRAAGVARDRLAGAVVQGVDPQGEFYRAIVGNAPQMDEHLAQTEVVAAAMALKARAPDLTELVLECTNMPPYARAIEQATGLRCWSLKDDVRLFKPFDLTTQRPHA